MNKSITFGSISLGITYGNYAWNKPLELIFKRDQLGWTLTFGRIGLYYNNWDKRTKH